MDTGFLTRTIMDGVDARLYQVYVPSDYDPKRAWPVILFLHGSGEGGRDGLLPTEYQLGSAIRRAAGRFPGLVAFPQVATRKYVWESCDVDFALRVLDQVEQDFHVDADRVYLTGVSTGAKAAWHALYRNPRRFAAALIVAGTVRPVRADGTLFPDADPVVPNDDPDPTGQLAQRIAHLPVWTFHGDDDPVFPVSEARVVAQALTDAGAPARYSEISGFGHDVWDIAYYAPEVTDWLLAQHRIG